MWKAQSNYVKSRVSFWKNMQSVQIFWGLQYWWSRNISSRHSIICPILPARWTRRIHGLVCQEELATCSPRWPCRCLLPMSLPISGGLFSSSQPLHIMSISNQNKKKSGSNHHLISIPAFGQLFRVSVCFHWSKTRSWFNNYFVFCKNWYPTALVSSLDGFKFQPFA